MNYALSVAPTMASLVSPLQPLARKGMPLVPDSPLQGATSHAMLVQVAKRHRPPHRGSLDHRAI